MKFESIFGLLAAALLMSSCDTETVRVSAETSSREFTFDGYTGLKVSGDFDVFVRFSETEERIEIEANTNLHDKIIVSKEGNTLNIGLENNVNIRGNATMKAYVVTRNISAYRISGDSYVELENMLRTANVTVNATGSSQFRGELEASTFSVDLKGDSEANVFGSVQTLDASLSGDSELKDYDMAVDRLTLKLSGDSEAFLSVSESIDINASGDSELNYQGEAEIIHERLTGDSQIRKRD